MRALRVAGGTLRVEEIARPTAAGEAVIRVTRSGICNTDLEIARGYAGFAGTIGHELVGVVEDPGAGPIAPGERVVAEINAGCGACARCAAGDPRHCPTRTVMGIVGRDGAHAEYLRIPAVNLHRVPAGVTDERAVFVEPLAAACGVLERCPRAGEPGAAVAVVGDGKLGLLCAMVVAAAGGAPVLVGKHAQKLAIAARRGVTTCPAAAAGDLRRRLDVVIEASGRPDGLALALGLLRPQGTLVLKSTFHGATPVDSAAIVVDEITVIGSRCGRFGPALALLARGAVDVDALVSEVMPLADAVGAMRRAAQSGVLKVQLATA